MEVKESYKPIVLVGGGGHASVLMDILHRQKRDVVCVVSPDAVLSRSIFSDLNHVKDDKGISHYHPDQVLLVNGLGMGRSSSKRRELNNYFVSLGYKFTSVISQSAYISDYVVLGEGIHILPQVVIQPGVVIGSNTIINTGALIEHDSSVGDFSHIAPRVAVCGDVSIGDDVFIGAGAVIVNGVSIGCKQFVKAGSLVKK